MSTPPMNFSPSNYRSSYHARRQAVPGTSITAKCLPPSLSGRRQLRVAGTNPPRTGENAKLEVAVNAMRRKATGMAERRMVPGYGLVSGRRRWGESVGQ
eukprot:2261992-Rhodomonas_salina.2